MTASAIARVTAFGLAAFALSAAPVIAAQTPTTATYRVQSVITNASGSLVANELLNIVSLDGRAAVTLVQQNTGEYARFAAPIDANGVLGLVTPDPALTCYNTAQGIIAGASAPSGAALAVSFGGNALSIPLRLAASASASSDAQDVTIAGRIEGTITAQPQDTPVAIVVDGGVRIQQHQLATIQLRETTVLTSTQAAIGQTSCTISRVMQLGPGAPA